MKKNFLLGIIQACGWLVILCTTWILTIVAFFAIRHELGVVPSDMEMIEATAVWGFILFIPNIVKLIKKI